ncbi:hypothetical protein BELL_1373g00010 [Botrytis elliptica]|uniref:Uncharacterized protein n=1 Tax=Botrytis elliptica TaxID=278938 RepID=A0A4Z1ID92_9HELO|nr:hypothetical protein BELL_1373g00010 [Botrytis elliptica]
MWNKKSKIPSLSNTTLVTSILDKKQLSLSQICYFCGVVIEYRHHGVFKFFSMSCPRAKCTGIASTDIQNWIDHMESHKDASWNKPWSDLSKEEMCLMFCGQRIDASDLHIRAWIVEQRMKQQEKARDHILSFERAISTGEITLRPGTNIDTSQPRQRTNIDTSQPRQRTNIDTSQSRQRKASSQSSYPATSQAPHHETPSPISSSTARPSNLLRRYTPPLKQVCLGLLVAGGIWYYGIAGQTGSFVLYQGFCWTAALRGYKNLVEEYDPSTSSLSFADHCAQNGDRDVSNLIANERVATCVHEFSEN